MFLGALFAGSSCAKSPTSSSLSGDEVTIFDNGNILAVFNSPTAATRFAINESYRIVLIENYHWNDGQGKSPGTIGLRNDNGQELGPWSVTTRLGQGGVPNAYWDARPDVVIGPGTYTVLDSDPGTWSQNDDSGGQGISRIYGTRE